MARTEEVWRKAVSAEVLPVPGLGVWAERTSQAWHPVPTAILALDRLEGGRSEDGGPDGAAVRGEPGVVRALGAATQLCEVAAELPCTPVVTKALLIVAVCVDCDLSVSCRVMGYKGDLQSRASKSAPKVSLASGYPAAAAAVWSCGTCWAGWPWPCWRSCWSSGIQLAAARELRDQEGGDLPLDSLALRLRLLRGGILAVGTFEESRM